MKTTLLSITTLLLIVAGSSSCSDKNKKLEDLANITGKWKLVNVTIPFTSVGPISHDYSQHNIVYEFNADSILTVSGETDHIDLYRGHLAGEYLYSIIEDDNRCMLNIDNRKYGYHISSKELEFNNIALDGFIYNLIRFN
ncbi:MAG: hypothetical protein FWH23_08360 [Bacteroidales bacterium]|nr:hypothetical protein [Bacteroidales bacterium]